MGLFNWISEKFNRSSKGEEMVPYYDVKEQRVVRIPARELRPGTVQARLEGADEVVWVLAEDLKMGELQHPPVDEETRNWIRHIHEAFVEHRPLSLDEWEDGFRRDANPEKEIAMWCHAADVYTAFAGTESSQKRRKDYYRIIVACLTCSADSIWNVLQLEDLSRQEAGKVIDRCYGKV
jgi:hypothetical protein